jgi:hypothetical protein
MPRNNKILIRKGTTVPTAENFDVGEPAWDALGKKLYLKAQDGTMAPISGGGSSVTLSETPPVSPNKGDQWLDKSTGILFLYDEDADSSQWVEYSAPTQSRTFISSPTVPVGPVEGQEWFNSDTGITYRYLFSTWIEVVGVATTEVPIVITSATSTSLNSNDTLVIKREGSVLQVALNDLVAFLENSASSGFNIPGRGFTASATPPTSPVQGDEWYDIDNGVSYRYVYGLWVEVGA